MEIKKELKILLWIVAIFLGIYFIPLQNDRFMTAVGAMLDLTKWYAREHIILCLLPAFLIAGVISVFVSQAAVIKYFGSKAKKWVAYTVASLSGTILAVCSCTILPLFSSIYKRGAGLGPAIAFLYSGPAINILAIILTARILGPELGIARFIGAVVFSIIIGLTMSLIYRKEEKNNDQTSFPDVKEKRPLWQTSLHFFTLVLILVFANWGKPANGMSSGLWFGIYSLRWWIVGLLSLILGYSLVYILRIDWWKVLASFFITAASALLFKSPMISMVVGIGAISVISLTDKKEGNDNRDWILSSWDFAKQILPLLVMGVMIAGFLLGSTHGETALAGIVPNEWVSRLLGGNSLASNVFASVAGAFMYFATLTEVPIIQGLLGSGMGQGPALALLLSGPSLSLPSILVIKSVLGWKKTLVYIILVIVLSTIAGMLYGLIVA